MRTDALNTPPWNLLLIEAHVADMPVVIKIADDGNHETFQINHERYLSSVQVPEREQNQAYVATDGRGRLPSRHVPSISGRAGLRLIG
jgi:hypothetical protein